MKVKQTTSLLDLPSSVWTIARVQDVMRLALTCKKMYESLILSDEGWWVLCCAIAHEHDLFMPCGYDGGFRSLFFNHLLPSRGKWTTNNNNSSSSSSSSSSSQSFNIQVAVRFRPFEKRFDRDEDGLVLPLHQRLRLLKPGEKLTRESAALTREQMRDVLGEIGGQDLSPDIMQALLDSESLRGLITKARQDALAAAGGGNDRPDWDDSGAMGGEDENFNPNNNNNNDNNNGENGDGSARLDLDWNSISSQRNKDNNNNDTANNNNNNFDDETKTASRILLVQKSRVITFIPGAGIRPFYYGRVFDAESTQEDVYNSAARDAVISALNGYNACILCYGQTASGKSHTIFGPEGWIQGFPRSKRVLPRDLPPSAGVAPRAIAEILQAKREYENDGGNDFDDELGGGGGGGGGGRNNNNNIHIAVSVQYVEIYLESLLDLTTGNTVQLRDGGRERGSQQFQLVGCNEVQVETVADVMAVLREGERRKRIGCTRMNVRSSRAHTCLLVTITQTCRKRGTMIRSQLHIVDLAGCEQIRQSGIIEGNRKRELVGINSSLLVLRKCISALTNPTANVHVPYHESKLSMLLKGAFGGNSKTVTIVTASPKISDADMTVQALRFGEACNSITNKTVQATQSIESALSEIIRALKDCAAAIENLNRRNLNHLPSFRCLKERYEMLLLRRREIEGRA